MLPAVCTDHPAIISFSAIAKAKRGPSHWKFNNSLLKDNNVINQIKEKIEDLLSSNTFAEDSRVNCEFLKYKMKGFSRNYSIDKKHKNTAEKFELEAKLNKTTVAAEFMIKCSNPPNARLSHCVIAVEVST